MHTGADQVLLTRDAETPVRRPGRDQHRMALDLLPAGQSQADVAGLSTLGGDLIDAHGAEQFDLVTTRLCDESLGEVRTANAFGEAGIVVDALGDAGLAAEPAAFDHHGVNAFSGRIDRGGEPGRAAADDREVVAAPLRLEGEPELARQHLVGGIDEHLGTVEDDGRNRAAALLQLLDVLERDRVLVDVDPVVGHALLREESLRALAVRAPRSAIDGDLRHQVSFERSALMPARVPRKRSTIRPLALMTINVGGSITLYSEVISSLASFTLAYGTLYVRS